MKAFTLHRVISAALFITWCTGNIRGGGGEILISDFFSGYKFVCREREKVGRKIRRELV
jgi:hypothetical protein